MSPFDEEEDDVLWEDDEPGNGVADEEENELDDFIAEVEELTETGQLRKAVRLWRRSIDRFSDEPEAYFHYGLTCFRRLEEEAAVQEIWHAEPELVGLYEEASGALEEAVNLEDDNHEAWNVLGALYALRENHQEARKAWQRSLEIDPHQPQVKQDLKAILHTMGEDDE